MSCLAEKSSKSAGKAIALVKCYSKGKMQRPRKRIMAGVPLLAAPSLKDLAQAVRMEELGADANPPEAVLRWAED